MEHALLAFTLAGAALIVGSILFEQVLIVIMRIGVANAEARAAEARARLAEAQNKEQP